MEDRSRRKILFPEVTDEQWNDWKWQVKNRIETLDQLKKYIKLTPEEEEGVRKTLSTLRMAITPYYLSLIDPDDPHCPIRRQAIPTAAETFQAPEDLLDPLHEDEDSPTPGLTHRYPAVSPARKTQSLPETGLRSASSMWRGLPWSGMCFSRAEMP